MTAPDAMRSLKMSFIIHWKVAGELAEEHNHGFEQPPISSECCLPLVTTFDAYIVVAPSKVEFGKVFGTSQFIHQLRDERKRVSILDCHLVELTIILYWL